MNWTRTRAMTGALGLLGLIAIGATAVIAGGGSTSSEAKRCGADGNTVVADFPIEAASKLWEQLPAMLRAPELEGDDRPAHVVIFAGDFDPRDVPMVIPEDKPTKLSQVVCVIQADGTLNLYSDVSRSDSKWERP